MTSELKKSGEQQVDRSAARQHEVAESVARRVRQLLDPRIVKLELILTEACNLACSYCFECNTTRRRDMSVPTARRAVDFLIDASRDSEWIEITFLGGEPMLRFDVIVDVIEYAKMQSAAAGKRVYFSMTTNGLLLEEKHLAYFSDHGLRYCLSLDGASETNDRHRKTRTGNGSYKNISDKMRLLKQYQPWQGARVTVMPDAAAALRENIAHLHQELAINQFILGCASSVPWADNQIADYSRGLMETFEFYLEERLAKKSQRLRIALLEVGPLSEAYLKRGVYRWGCGAGSGRLAVAPDGTLHGCSKLAFAAKAEDGLLPLGTVETGFSRVGNRRRLLDHAIERRPKCRGCPLMTRCNGGCYAVNLTDTNNIYTPADYYCKLVFAQIAAADYARQRLKDMGLEDLHRKDGSPEHTPQGTIGEGIPEATFTYERCDP